MSKYPIMNELPDTIKMNVDKDKNVYIVYEGENYFIGKYKENKLKKFSNYLKTSLRKTSNSLKKTSKYLKKNSKYFRNKTPKYNFNSNRELEEEEEETKKSPLEPSEEGKKRAKVATEGTRVEGLLRDITFHSGGYIYNYITLLKNEKELSPNTQLIKPIEKLFLKVKINTELDKVDILKKDKDDINKIIDNDENVIKEKIYYDIINKIIETIKINEHNSEIKKTLYKLIIDMIQIFHKIGYSNLKDNNVIKRKINELSKAYNTNYNKPSFRRGITRKANEIGINLNDTKKIITKEVSGEVSAVMDKLKKITQKKRKKKTNNVKTEKKINESNKNRYRFSSRIDPAVISNPLIQIK